MSACVPNIAASNLAGRLAPFRSDHRDGVIALLTSVYQEYGQVVELDTLDSDLLNLDERFGPPRHTFQVLVDELGVVGSVAVQRKTDSDGELKRVFLHSRARGKGVGKALVLWAVDWARNAGLKTLHIWSDQLFDAAHHLYRRIGAEDTHLRRYLGGRNEIFELYFRLSLDSCERPRTPRPA